MPNLYALQMADPNLLSYSTLQEAQGCPRRYELNKKLAHKAIEEEDEIVDFAFGHAVAAGVQEYLLTGSETKALLACFLNWRTSMMEEIGRKKKSIWYAAVAVQKFIAQKQLLLGDWELFSFNGVPAIELSFLITDLPNNKRYRGDIDIVLKHPSTGKLMVIEIKTTGFNNVDEAVYKNSAQAVGYGVVLDQIGATDASYTVLYLVYQCGSMEWITFPFIKTRTEKALWIKNLLLDVQMIRVYEQAKHFPQRGQHCFSFFKRCPHYGFCGQSNEQLGLDDRAVADARAEEVRRYMLPHFNITMKLHDVVRRQVELL